VLVSKYCDHLPLYRQSEIYAREGVELERSTLADWVGSTSQLLAPLVEALRRHVLSATKLHADDTPVPVLAPGNGKTKTGRLWTYVRDDRPSGDATPAAVWFAYSPDRKGEHPQSHLGNFTGTLQADGYAGFDAVYETGRIQEAACWAHVRRKFYDLHVAHKSPVAAEAIERIAALYAIEKEIRGHPAEQRRAVRNERARSLLDSLKQWLEETLGKLSRKSDTAMAVRYALSRWEALLRYVNDGRIEIGRVEDRRGGCSLPVDSWPRFRAASSVRADIAPFPAPAQQTGRADFPHPAFSRSVRPSLSTGPHAESERRKGQASRRDTCPGSGRTRSLFVPFGASTSAGLFVRCSVG
jgi:hypothetical protein